MHPTQMRPEEGGPSPGARRVFAVLRERERVRGHLPVVAYVLPQVSVGKTGIMFKL